MRVIEAGVTVLLCLSLSRTADAGRSRFGWLYDTDVVPERTVEVEGWVLEEDGKGKSPGEDETLVWWAPVVGVTDRVELALPIEIAHTEQGTQSQTALERVGAEVRWRLTNPDPVERGPFAALVRAAVKRLVTERNAVRFEENLVLSLELGRVYLATDLGLVEKVDSKGHADPEGRPGVGVSIRIVDELRMGAELYAEVRLGNQQGVDWVTLGPNLAWTHGRFWLSASCPIGLSNITAAPRLNWAVAF